MRCVVDRMSPVWRWNLNAHAWGEVVVAVAVGGEDDGRKLDPTGWGIRRYRDPALVASQAKIGNGDDCIRGRNSMWMVGK